MTRIIFYSLFQANFLFGVELTGIMILFMKIGLCHVLQYLIALLSYVAFNCVNYALESYIRSI